MSASADVTALLRRLVAIDSTSSKPNAAVVDVLEPALTSAGFETRRLTYRDDAGVEKTNLVARKGPAGRCELALVGHTDCVPFDPSWREALTLGEQDGKLFGRGACDTKAFVSCALVAASRVAIAKPLALIFTADEEVGCTGAKKLVESKAIDPRRAIVGEPTSLTPIRAHKGYCMAEVEVRGVEGHSAYPRSGASAIFRAARLIERIEQLSNGALQLQGEPLFEPPYTTVNVGLISGGKAKNIIPGSCRFTLEWRPIPSQRVEHVPELVNGAIAELKRDEPAFDASVNVLRLDRGVDTAERADVVQFLVEQSGKKPATVSFGTEAPQLTQLGAEACVFGPGNIQVAHRTGEFVPIAELLRCEEILEAAIARFCR